MGSWFSSLFGWTWLSGRTQGLCDQLQNAMQPCLKDIKTQGATANDSYNQVAVNLNNPKIYQGQGAQAFLSAVDTDINRSRPLLDSFGHAASAAGMLASSISQSSSRYDSRIAGISIPFVDTLPPFAVPSNLFDKWRDNLINTFFINMSNMAAGGNSDLMSELLQNGSTTMGPPWSAAVKTVQVTVSNDAEQYASSEYDFFATPPPPSNGAEYAEPTPQEKKAQQAAFTAQMEQVFMDAFNSLCDDLHLHIWNWAGELHTSYLSFQSTLRNVNSLTAQDLFDMINGMDGNDPTQSTNKPITITPYTTKDGKKGLLITIGGTDLNDWSYDTDLFTALQTGQGGPNPYKIDVENAILQYLKEHPEMAGAELTFAGYSLGGMTAQQVADDIGNGQDPALSQYHLHVAQVITYGSPVMGPPLQGVRYDMYDATYDPIPLLSSYENPGLSQLPNMYQNPLQQAFKIAAAPVTMPTELGTLIGTDQLPWNTKLHGYIDPRGQYIGEIHDITDIGNNSVQGINGPPFFANHLQYQTSNQLNASTTADTDINPGTLGPTEYFGMSNTNNFVAQNGPKAQAFGQGILEGLAAGLL